MNQTSPEERTHEMPTRDGTQEVVRRAKRTFKSIRARDKQEHDHTEHETWVKSLTPRQRRAHEAHQADGPALDERARRDLLHAALSLHEPRDGAAQGLERPQDIEPAAEAAIVRETDGPRGIESLLTPEATGDKPPTNREVFDKAAERIQGLAEEVRAARETHTAKYEALGMPELPKDSPRRKLLEQALVPERSAGGRPKALQPIDQRVRALYKDIVDDPLWIAADYLDRTTSLEKVDDLVRKDEGVVRAQDEYKKAEDRVRKAARALDDYTPRTRWKRALDTVRGHGQSNEARLLALHGEMKGASLALNEAKREVEGAERRARSDAQELNAQSLFVQREACQRRDELEQPLRHALLDRHIGERALAGELVLHHLRDAPDLGSLTYAGERTVAGFPHHEFRNFGGARFLGDVALDRSIAKLDLAPGDRVLLRADEHGARHLQIDARAERPPPALGLQLTQGLARDRNVADGRGR